MVVGGTSNSYVQVLIGSNVSTIKCLCLCWLKRGTERTSHAVMCLSDPKRNAEHVQLLIRYYAPSTRWDF
jgi:hypothetical protein